MGNKILVLILSIFAVTACSPYSRTGMNSGSVPKNLRENSGLTGSTYKNPITEQEIPYTDTVSSDTLQNVKENLENEWKDKNIGSESMKLAQSISKTQVRILRVDSTTNLVANLVAANELIQFNIPIVSGHIPETKRYSEAKTLDYTLSGKCTDSTCSEVSLYLTKYNSNAELVAKVGFVTRTLKAYLQTHLSKDQKSVIDNNLKNIYSKYRDEQEIEVNDVIFANAGTSTSTVHIDDNIDFNIKNLETTETEADIAVEGDQEIQAKLLGNSGVKSLQDFKAPKAANNFIVITKNKEKIYATLNRAGKSNLFKPEATTQEVGPEVTDATLRDALNQYLIKVNTANPRVLEITRGFERYRNWRGLKSATDSLLKRRPIGTIQTYFNNIKPVLPVFQKVSDIKNIPNTMTSISLRESRYFYDGKNPKKIEIGEDCEVGPFQMTERTGKGIYPNVIFPLEGQIMEGKKPKCYSRKEKINTNDDRKYLLPAWNVSAEYLRRLSEMFDDSALIIMAYNLGEGAVSSLIRDLSNAGFDKIQRLGEYKIRGVPAAINYANDFLALYFIAANPEKHGIDRNQSTNVQYSCEEVYSPSQIKDGMCKLAD